MGRLYTPGGASAQIFACTVSAHHQSLWVCHLAQLSFLCGSGFTPDTGLLVGIWGAVASGIGPCGAGGVSQYHDWREHKVKDIHHGVFYATRFASTQGSLVSLTPQESLVLYRPKPVARQAQLPFPAQQLWLFELVQTA